ncbi:hypothetical protein M378DRAFT_522715 [Amanita muscaria Koide BX008]|uniref:Uncharacterized protein n=1 Tax=Amanita muscaria (strain Koide BX008) TaxID=946122 RepID=A0A0C2WJV4_AMAMK|nr:hypothetical protein M378DRAFT_522715 [Amanita muscaria Koide BX008]
MTLCGCCDSASKVDQAEEEGWKKIQTTCPATDDAAQHERNAIQSFTVHVFGLIPDTDVGKARIGFTCMRLEWSCRRRSFNAGGARLDMPLEARICSFAPPDCIFAIFVSRMAHQFLEDVIQVVPHYSFENEDLLPSNACCEPPGSLGGKEYCGNTGPMLLSSI